MATLKGSTVQNWYATLNYTSTVQNNQLKIVTSSIKITTLAAYTATSKKWNSANATFNVYILDGDNSDTTLQSWSLTGQTWNIGPGKSKTINFSKTKVIDATDVNRTIKLRIRVVYNNNTSVNTTSITLPKLPSSTITFNQGTSNISPPSTITTTGNWTVPSIEMTRISSTVTQTNTTEVTTYEFRGWSTLSNVTNGNNISYVPNTSYARPANDITLYPGYLSLITTYQSAIVNFDKGEVSSASNLPGQLRDNSSIVVGNNITFTIPNNIPTASGKVFTHWEDSNGRIYNPTDQIIVQSGVQTTLYAHWVNNTATLVLNTTGGNIISDITISYSSAQTLSVSPSRTGYTFSGWAKEQGGTIIWNSGDNFKTANSRLNTENEYVIPNGYTIYAIWEEQYRTVTYNANGTISEPAYLGNVPNSEQMDYSKVYYITDQVPMRTGYTFLGWNTNSSATTPLYYENSLFKNANTLGSNTTLYAIWRSNTETSAEIIYNANGGSLGAIVSPQPINYTNAAYISSIIPTKAGYKFLHWHSTTNNMEYDPGDEYKDSGTPSIRTNLIAQWEINANFYLGVNNKADQITNIYIGDENNTARTVIAVYIGDANGKAKRIMPKL